MVSTYQNMVSAKRNIESNLVRTRCVLCCVVLCCVVLCCVVLCCVVLCCVVLCCVVLCCVVLCCVVLCYATAISLECAQHTNIIEHLNAEVVLKHHHRRQRCHPLAQVHLSVCASASQSAVLSFRHTCPRRSWRSSSNVRPCFRGFGHACLRCLLLFVCMFRSAFVRTEICMRDLQELATFGMLTMDELGFSLQPTGALAGSSHRAVTVY